jgi:hypothetical protein
MLNVFGQCRQAPAVLARERDGQQAQLPGDLEAVHEVRRLPARAEGEGHVARTGQRAELVAEDPGEVTVVGDRREERGVGGQRDRGQTTALLDDRVAELHGHVLGVGGAAAVAHDVESATALEGDGHRARERLDPVRLDAEEPLLDVGALARLAEDGVLHGTDTGSPRWRP